MLLECAMLCDILFWNETLSAYVLFRKHAMHCDHGRYDMSYEHATLYRHAMQCEYAMLSECDMPYAYAFEHDVFL